MLNDALKMRRSIYALGKELPVEEEIVLELIKDAVEFVPDAFNMKSQNVVVALGENQSKLLDGIAEVFGGKIPKEKIDGFRGAAGTILFFSDRDVVENLQNKFPSYANNFPLWSEQSNGMLQISIWAGLRELGIGANIQHYNPIIDKLVKEMFDVPDSMKLIAQMPFGNILQEPDAKEREDMSKRVKVVR